MKLSGPELLAKQLRLKVSPEMVCAEARVCTSTLYKVYGEKPVSFKSIELVRGALDRLEIVYGDSKAS